MQNEKGHWKSPLIWICTKSSAFPPALTPHCCSFWVILLTDRQRAMKTQLWVLYHLPKLFSDPKAVHCLAFIQFIANNRNKKITLQILNQSNITRLLVSMNFESIINWLHCFSLAYILIQSLQFFLIVSIVLLFKTVKCFHSLSTHQYADRGVGEVLESTQTQRHLHHVFTLNVLWCPRPSQEPCSRTRAHTAEALASMFSPRGHETRSARTNNCSFRKFSLYREPDLTSREKNICKVLHLYNYPKLLESTS